MTGPSDAVAYGSDDAARLATITLDGGAPAFYSYDDGGRRTRQTDAADEPPQLAGTE